MRLHPKDPKNPKEYQSDSDEPCDQIFCNIHCKFSIVQVYFVYSIYNLVGAFQILSEPSHTFISR